MILPFCPISLQDGVAADFTSLTKTLYDLHKVQEHPHYKGSPLDELVVENFDEEQIWQELELQNSAVLTHFKKAVKNALSDKTLTLVVEEESAEENVEEEEVESDCVVDLDEDERPSRGSKVTAPEAEDEADDYTDEGSDFDFDVDALEKQEKQKKKSASQPKHKTKVVPSEVDDKFFRLSEMESFLDDMDKREGKEEDEDEIDYFQDLPSDMDDDLDLEELLSSKKTKKSTVSFSFLF